jgi:uncharacterized protein (TIGR00255 family)
MLLSMTGYGRASKNYNDKTIVVEIRSLNGKTTDLRLKLPNAYKEKELNIRKRILTGVGRGKVDVSIEVLTDLGDGEYGLNKKLFTKYFEELKSLKNELGIDSGDLLQSILRIPNVVQSENVETDEEEWKVLNNAVDEALVNLKKFRTDEGDSTKEDLKEKIMSILSCLEAVVPFESQRIDAVKNRLRKNLEDFMGNENVDQNRFEQEVLFYIEKIDINEEKVRLKQHCEYFLEELAKEEAQKGRKLSFISQEIGREINTMGAKAQFSEIQKLVVKMKDELEQIKEQVANVV